MAQTGVHQEIWQKNICALDVYMQILVSASLHALQGALESIKLDWFYGGGKWVKVWRLCRSSQSFSASAANRQCAHPQIVWYY